MVTADMGQTKMIAVHPKLAFGSYLWAVLPRFPCLPPSFFVTPLKAGCTGLKQRGTSQRRAHCF